MGFLRGLFGGKVNEAAQHQISVDILNQQHSAIKNILNEIMPVGEFDYNELVYFTSFIASSAYLVGALTANLNHDDANIIVEHYMRGAFTDPREFQQAVERHKMYMPVFHAAAGDAAAYIRLASQFISNCDLESQGTETTRIAAWLSTSLQSVMIQISRILKDAGQR